MKLAKGIALFAAIVAALLFAWGLSLPSAWTVSRSIVVDAPPAAIYPLIADMKEGWPQWSAFDTEDPNIVYAHSGAASGAGAVRSWKSPKMGDGSQTITDVSPETGVKFVLEMSGFKLYGTVALSAQGKSTRVIWTDTGDVGRSVPKRILVRFMDRMMGGTFEKSLAALKAKAEARAAH